MTSDAATDATADAPTEDAELIRWCEGLSCCNERWEAAYNRFETPEEEIAKFRQRLTALGAGDLPRDARVADIFCGSGRNLIALEQLGFTDLRGVDLSPELLRQYDGPAQRIVGDATDLQFDDASLDVVIVQGGLHHLPTLPDDLDRFLAGVVRVLRPGGQLFVVEPWMTPFLWTAHACCKVRPLTLLWGKLDALRVMIEEEVETYHAWLSQPDMIRDRLATALAPEVVEIGWGKLMGRYRRRD